MGYDSILLFNDIVTSFTKLPSPGGIDPDSLLSANDSDVNDVSLPSTDGME